MFFGLKKVKKVRPAKSQIEGCKVYFPNHYLFWGERFVEGKEDGVDFGYIEKECFLGNTDEGRLSKGDSGTAFAMRKLTGEQEGELFFPELRGADIFVKVPQNGTIAEYEIVVDEFKLGNKASDGFSLGEIVRFAKEQNEQRRQTALNIERARKESIMG